MADVITTLHPEGIPTDNLYPNIKKENLPSDLQPVADFAISEYEKTLNIWDEIAHLGYRLSVSGDEYAQSGFFTSLNFIEVISNAIYYAKSAVALLICFYDDNKQFISYGEASNSTFTTPSNCKYIKFSTSGTTYNHDITISKGANSVGYLPYSGKVIHEIDCQGVILWENGSPNAPFSATTISVADMSDFRELKIVYKNNTDSTKGNFVQFVEYATGKSFTLSLHVPDLSDVYGRTFTIATSTTIQISDGAYSGGGTSYACIPVAIYGIK